MILCVVPNAAIDRTLVVPGLALGKVFRPIEVVVAAGGKGFNVARAVKVLGGQARCIGFLAGHEGRLVAELAEREGLGGLWTWVDGETRTCVIIVDPQPGQATVVNEHGPTITDDDWERLQAEVLREAARADCVCLSGSLPLGASPDWFVSLIRELHKAGQQVWVDTSGRVLESALNVDGLSVKVNGDEAGAILGRPVTDARSALEAATQLRRRGVREVVLTLGAEGAIFVGEPGAWWAKPPRVRAVSAVGSGDCFLAALTLALTAGLAPSEALKRAVAAGAANALSVGGGRFQLSDYERIRSETRLEAL